VASPALPGVPNRILRYLNRIDERSGKANRMDFLRIAGNEEMLNDWIDYLSRCNLIGIETKDGKSYFVKTDIGQKLHDVLKVHAYLGPVLGDLGRNRRRPRL
jgi:hypothetical protein